VNSRCTCGQPCSPQVISYYCVCVCLVYRQHPFSGVAALGGCEQLESCHHCQDMCRFQVAGIQVEGMLAGHVHKSPKNSENSKATRSNKTLIKSKQLEKLPPLSRHVSKAPEDECLSISRRLASKVEGCWRVMCTVAKELGRNPRQPVENKTLMNSQTTLPNSSKVGRRWYKISKRRLRQAAKTKS
jgi:hypothetical protein